MSGTDDEPQERRRNGRRVKVDGIDEARQRWQVIQSRGRIRGVVALVVAIVVAVLIAVLAGSNASVVAIVVILAVIVVAVILGMIGKSRTGLSLTPEWKPETPADDVDDLDEADDLDEVDRDGDGTVAETAVAVDASEPVRRLDAQILGEDLAKLGQVVSPKLAKSYAVGSLVLEDGNVVWEPGTTSRATGIGELEIAPAQVSVVETVPLWGAWALLRLATADGDEWCMRVPGSVDLTPAFADMGLTLRKHD